MVENPDFFDPSLPITAVQLIVVDYARLGKRTGRGWRLAASALGARAALGEANALRVCGGRIIAPSP
jgi:hypothetical protein